MPGMGELLIILVIVLLVFGANKLPQLGDGIGTPVVVQTSHGTDNVDLGVYFQP